MRYDLCIVPAKTGKFSIRAAIICEEYAKLEEKDFAIEVVDNASILQFLDFMKEIRDIAEIDGTELTDRLIGYMKANDLRFGILKQYFPYYPDRLCRNMYEVGLLNGVVA